ncbi:MAG: FAD-dependent oxidoreductase [Dehalococcoidia bacterium]
MAMDEEYDVVAVGSGAGGLTAAVTASAKGGRALVLEKDDMLGGVTALSGGQVWIGASHVGRAAGIKDTLAETEAYLTYLSDGFAQPELRKVYVSRGPEVLRFLCDEIGIPFQLIDEWPDYYYPDAPGSKGAGRFLETAPFTAADLGEWEALCVRGDYVVTSHDRSLAGGSIESLGQAARLHAERGELCAGAALSAYLIRAALAHGVEFRVATPAVRLLTKGDRVIGVEAKRGGETLRIGARRGVVLATGAYDWNPEHVQTYEQMTGLVSATPPTIEGDHIVMASELGATVVSARPSAANTVLYGFSVPGEPEGRESHKLVVPGWPHSIVVNSRGERFADDSFLSDVAIGMGRYFGVGRGFANSPAWLIFDQEYRDKYPLGPYYPDDQLPRGLVTVRDSPTDLAEAVGMDPRGLEATITMFNEYCATGVDAEFGRGSRKYSQMMTGDHSLRNPNLGPISRGPYYAMDFVRIGVGIPTAGLKIDGEAQVIGVRGNVINGLYAAGNAAAHTDIGAGYTSGIANARGLIYGYLAAISSMQ